MTAFFGLLTFVLFLVLIVGLIKPSMILVWVKKPTRLKLFGIWTLSILILVFFGSLFISDEERAKSTIDLAKTKIEEGDYESAINRLSDIDEENSFYKSAQGLIKKADSIRLIKEREKQLAIELEEKQKREHQTELFQQQLERELNSIEKGIDFSTYRGSIASIQIELLLFAAWAENIKEAQNHSDAHIQELGKKLENKVQNIQAKEFPLLRKNYGVVVGEKLWPQNIETSVYGNGNKIIQFTGGIFANNKNKMEVQAALSEILNMLRFNRVNYKWYKYDDEYTYYNLDTPSDKEILIID